jgi:ribosomal protein S18 acetylase RimI-like enzyme
MNKIIEVAKKRFTNLNKISLYVMITNISAINFYESLNFKKEKLLKNYYQSFNQDGLLYIKYF